MAEMRPKAEQCDRRFATDRRGRPTAVFSRYTISGQRRQNRRQTDPKTRYYVDWIDGAYSWVLIALAILIGFDTFSTLHILSLGGLELNPLMSWLHSQGSEWFIMAKLAPPLIVLPLLAVHRFFAVAWYGTNLLLLAYVCVFIVHLIMLSIIYV